MIETRYITDVTPALSEFIGECNSRGFKNNNNLKAMKFYNTLNEGGHWFATFNNSKIVGVSGMHHFKDGWRALFRGAQLHSMPGGLSKNHMNCWMFYYHLPLVIDLASSNPIYITTNTNTDESGSMLRLNKLYSILEKKRIVEFISTEQIFYVEQNVWKLNHERYFELRPEVK